MTKLTNNGLKVTALPVERLRWRCEPSRLPFETTAQAELREGLVGQDRALRALKMGVELTAPGYNVFVCGLSGTSRAGTISKMIGELHPSLKRSPDGSMTPLGSLSLKRPSLRPSLTQPPLPAGRQVSGSVGPVR